MKKVAKIIPLLSGLLFCFACGNNNPDPGPIDCKDLCFTAVGSNAEIEWATTDDGLTSQLEQTIQISIDGRDWHTWDGSSGTAGFIFPMGAGEKFYIRNTSETLSSSASEYFYFITPESSLDKWNVSGDIRSLVNYTEEIKPYSFYSLFKRPDYSDGCSIIDASELLLPYTKLSEGCYQNMFANCSYLIGAPQLPATQLEDSCYESMFQGCHSLNIFTSEVSGAIKFLETPAEIQPESSVSHMFDYCGGDVGHDIFEVLPGQSYYYKYQPGPYGQ
ncbi:MAG: hypothetical protein MJ207_01155 [Bacilli bacterium]|nr:hypothetical protein [Bacilli bacterium]